MATSKKTRKKTQKITALKIQKRQKTQKIALKSIRIGCKLCDRIISELVEKLKSDCCFKTEADVSRFINKRIRNAGYEPAFKTIVASGRNAAKPHHKTSKQRLNSGFCVIDFGARVNGYCSDMSRTIYIGRPAKKEKELYNLVLKVQKSSIMAVRPGKSYRDIDLYARNMFGRRKKRFIHGLGHGLGKRIHQRPRISPKSKDTARIGDIITIEPGLYKKGRYGLRIEDDLIVSRKGAVVLTKAEKKLVVV